MSGTKAAGFSNIVSELFGADPSASYPSCGSPLTTENSSNGSGGPNSVPLSYANLVANTDYYLVFEGALASATGAFFGAISVSSVPPPTALPLFALGLAPFGVVARRRRSAKAWPHTLKRCIH